MITQDLKDRFLGLLDLKTDTDFVETDASIRKNVDFKSANAWTLVFAIVIASVGLNTNSTAVIIGAMLVSPLMGPIVGAGYALGINDFDLLNRSWRNLLIAVGISLVASMFYFIISPLSEVQSELLARTSPTFYDVLIAAFGGSAGIVAMSRKEKSNAIPGVAIATALMPPLCTAGFGLANLKWSYVAGALYLFIINSVFICLATYMFVRYLRFTRVSYSNAKEQTKINRWIMAVASVVIVPSLVLAWMLLQESTFKSKANSFIDREVRFRGTVLLEKKLTHSFKGSSIELTLMGDSLSKTKIKMLEERKSRYGLENTKLELNQMSIDDRINQRLEASKNAPKDQTSLLREKIIQLETVLNKQKSMTILEEDITKELNLFNPEVLQVRMSSNDVSLIWKRLPSKIEKAKVEKFLKQRLKNELIVITNLKTI
ncbi:MAG: DUF389 domain-containing protein [Bacteriovoracaceae bacterium]|nr:DUF389 domain-containing protein [Bacteriovoracaceae bacterium]